jgi:hypothetical protein
MGLVAKIAERVTEVLPHSGVDGSRELIIAPGPDIIAPAGNAVSTLPVAHVLMGLTIDLVSASIPFCAYTHSLLIRNTTNFLRLLLAEQVTHLTLLMVIKSAPRCRGSSLSQYMRAVQDIS